jgi:hypothetical protein
VRSGRAAPVPVGSWLRREALLYGLARAVEGRQGSMEPAEGARLIRNNMPVVLESLLVAIKHNRAVVS